MIKLLAIILLPLRLECPLASWLLYYNYHLDL